jgi:cytoskeletal protein RodZ
MNKKFLLYAASLGLLLLMLWGCVYYVPAPNSEPDFPEAVTTAEGGETTSDTTDVSTDDSTAETTASIEDNTASTSPTERDDGYTGYH